MKNCPKCGIANPDDSRRCDCGYDFVSEQPETPDLATTLSKYAPNAGPPFYKVPIVLMDLIFIPLGVALVLGGFFGFFTSLTYDRFSNVLFFIILAGAIGAICCEGIAFARASKVSNSLVKLALPLFLLMLSIVWLMSYLLVISILRNIGHL